VRITIVGGGPAGLYFALLMKKRDPAHQIRIYERDGRNDTYGWGIVFSGQTLSFLEEADPESHRAIAGRLERWDRVDVVHQSEKVSVHGNRFAGIARVAFLDVLRSRCEELGVEIRYLANVERLEELPDADLLVGADGARSLVRRAFAEAFRPSEDVRKNRYLWLGTPRLFHGLTLTFRRSEAGVFAAHSYKFSPERSTFIVEAVGEAFERAGFEAKGPEDTCRYLEGIFADDLEGQPLLTNNFVRWLRFVIVKNGRWHHRNVVLLGDALHTAHFSIGSGTKLAVEDSIALASCFARNPTVADALSAFEAERKPVVDSLQAAAHSSLTWFEQCDARLHLSPLDLAYELMTRSGRVDHEKLKRRDPSFVAAWEGQGAGRRAGASLP
jgi:anthraniloyl-CoA monooxygenase